jgi:hypothetical protein
VMLGIWSHPERKPNLARVRAQAPAPSQQERAKMDIDAAFANSRARCNEENIRLGATLPNTNSSALTFWPAWEASMSVVHRAYNCSRPQKVQAGRRSASYNRLFTRKIFFLSYLVQMYPVPLPYFPALLETDAARPPIPSDFHVAVMFWKGTVPHC